MALTPGQSLSHYQLLAHLGAGGMGEVWRARDTKLEREVAIKVLPEELSGDEDRLRRFEREAKSIASLNHPNVAGIHGVDQVGGICFLALELVPGEDLAARLARGALPLDEAVDVCRQIAEGLEAAHEAGVIHRDLKPANVRLTPEGVVKLLDFGLAKPLPSPESAVGGPPSATDSFLVTEEGMVLGTPTYMSPEQARGRPVDRRTDIWAFGCVLFECLTGTRAFAGGSAADLLSAILTGEPAWEQLPAATPPRVRELLRRCLAKDARLRLRDIGEARVVLTEVDTGFADPEPAGDATSGPRAGRPSRALLLVGALAVGVVVGRWLPAPGPPPGDVAEPLEAAFVIGREEEPTTFGSLALAPDGRHLAFLVRDETGEHHLAVRPLGSFASRRIPGTAGADDPFWSPDGTELGFLSGGRVMRVALDGSTPRVVAVASRPRGGSWSADDVILFGSEEGPIYRVDADGRSPPVAVTTLESPVEDTHVWPWFLPDGERFLFMTDAATDEGHRIRLGHLDGRPGTVLRTGVRSNIALDRRGALLFVENNQLVAVDLDPVTGTLGGDRLLVADGMRTEGGYHGYPFTVSGAGGLAFQRGSSGTEIVRIDLADGRRQVLASGGEYYEPALSPDGRHVAYRGGQRGDERLLWVEDVHRGTRTLMSDRGRRSDSPTWSHDGRMLYFDMEVDGRWHAFRRLADGGRPAERLPMPPGCDDLWTLDVSRDGEQLLISATSPESGWNLYLLPLAVLGDEPWTDEAPAERRAEVTKAWRRWPATADNKYGRLSPDGEWIAYRSDSSGRDELYVASTERGPAGGQLQLSVGGASEGGWTHDGTRFYYRSRNDVLMEVSLTYADGQIEATPPLEVMPLSLPPTGNGRNAIDVIEKGDALLATWASEEGFSEIYVQLGWHW